MNFFLFCPLQCRHERTHSHSHTKNSLGVLGHNIFEKEKEKSVFQVEFCSSLQNRLIRPTLLEAWRKMVKVWTWTHVRLNLTWDIKMGRFRHAIWDVFQERRALLDLLRLTQPNLVIQGFCWPFNLWVGFQLTFQPKLDWIRKEESW